MRYQQVDTVSFETAARERFAIKDMREYPTYTAMITLDVQDGDEIDEIATRPEVYGDEAEGESYKIVDNNIVGLFEARFDMTKVRTLTVPIR